ncbi:hypothetical protein FLP41_16300 [Paracoccus marcusii]|nr:hypothetical protein FLP41_16300 [Paracoccus marcusii]
MDCMIVSLGDDLAGAHEQQFQQRMFAGGQVHRLPSAGNGARSGPA